MLVSAGKVGRGKPFVRTKIECLVTGTFALGDGDIFSNHHSYADGDACLVCLVLFREIVEKEAARCQWLPLYGI